MAVRGRFHDGETAKEHLVEVIFAEDGLEIAGAGVRAFWRRQDVAVLDRSRRYWRLGASSSPDARLVLESSADVEAGLRKLGISGGRREVLRATALVGALVAASALLAAIVFVIIPVAAEPLAQVTPPVTEERLGANVTAQIHTFMRPCSGARAKAAEEAVAPLVDQLQRASAPAFNVQVTFVHEALPNAVTLPGGRVLVTEGLLETVQDPEAFAAVLAHEIGHVKARDGMVAMYRNAGLGILLEIITGGSGIAQQLVLLSGQVAELRYTRGQEARADRAALVIMRDTGHDPAALARAFEALKKFKRTPRSGNFAEKLRVPEWLQSHPDLDARIARAKAAAAPGGAETLSPEAWGTVRGACKG